MKAVALLSGGLDSALALKIILDQGIDVIPINFVTPFCLCDSRKKGCKKKALLIAKQLDIELKILNISEEYLEIVKNPKYGYGSNLNPCIDCRILIFKKAKEFMKDIGASFIVTGEVLGQRPMSQNKKAMEIIEKESGLEGFIVRPLCAKLFPPSLPEKSGWVNRQKLLDISGRSRKKQFELVKEYNITDYTCPAGGCLLTDPYFSLVIKDLLDSNMLKIENINLIKHGRYFITGNSFKLIVGRNEEENHILKNLAKEEDLIIEPEVKGPVAVGRGKIASENEIQTALKIVAYYCKDGNSEIRINFIPPYSEKKIVIFKDRPNEEEILKYRIKVCKY